MGNPGALFHFRDGGVVAVTSPGAPGADTVLIRSGRIDGDEWDAALCADARNNPELPAIVTRGAIDEAGLHEVLLAALWDAAFAAVVGEIDECVPDGESSEFVTLELPAAKGVPPDRVLAETTDRLRAFASLPVPVSPYRDRVVPAEAAPDDLAALGREIVEQANGRRNARDIAFTIGRGVHEVTVEISRMLGDGVLKIGPPPPAIITPHSDIREHSGLRRTGC